MGSIAEDAVKKHKNKDEGQQQPPGYGPPSQYGGSSHGGSSQGGSGMMDQLGGFFKK